MKITKISTVLSMFYVGMIATLSGPVCVAGTASAYFPRLSSYFQLRYTDPETGEDRLALRRFKAMLDGGPLDKLHYHLQFIYKTNNGSATDDRIFLEDAYLVIPLRPGLSLKAGQFIPPFGLERFQPDWNLDFVGRTNVTKRLAVNSNLGDSFGRDRGLEGDWDHAGWNFSGGIFQGAGANDPSRGNGPLGVTRLSYGRERVRDKRPWSWRAGLAGSARRITDLNLSGQLPGLSKDLTSHFQGRGARMDAFVQGNWGPFRAQAEYIRVWLNPKSGSEIVARGGYGQLAYLPIDHVILGIRHEWLNPDVRVPDAPPLDRSTAAVTYDFSRLPLRIVTDYSWDQGGEKSGAGWRLQLQYFLLRGFKLG